MSKGLEARFVHSKYRLNLLLAIVIKIPNYTIKKTIKQTIPFRKAKIKMELSSSQSRESRVNTLANLAS